MRHSALKSLSLIPAFLSLGLMMLPSTKAASLCLSGDLAVAVGTGGVHQFDCDGTIQLPATLVVSNEVTLDAAGHQVTLFGNGQVQLFRVETGGRLTLVGVTLSWGAGPMGGAIQNQSGGTIAATNCVFRFNSARDGGAIYNSPGATALFSQCLWDNNSAVGTNGSQGVFNSLATPGGPGGPAVGGALCNAGFLLVHRSTLRANTATGGQGGTGAGSSSFGWLPGAGGAGGAAAGGAIASITGQTWLVDCSAHENGAAAGHGGYGASGFDPWKNGASGGNGGPACGGRRWGYFLRDVFAVARPLPVTAAISPVQAATASSPEISP